MAIFTDYIFTVTRANPAGDSTVKWAIAPGNGITAEDFDDSKDRCPSPAPRRQRPSW